jgi:hypothetical protein
MLDISVEVPPGQFLCKAIRASQLVAILTDLGDPQDLIVEPNAVTGNLMIYRRIDADTMRSLGWVDVSGEYFEPASEPDNDFVIPEGWR